MTATTTSCDVCGKVKQGSNHWFRGLYPLTSFTLRPFDPVIEEITSTDICGQDCAHKALSQWFAQQRSLKP